MTPSVDYSWTGSWSIRPGQPPEIGGVATRRPAIVSEAPMAPQPTAASSAARSRRVATSARAKGPAAAVPSMQAGARFCSAGTDPAGIPRTRSLVRRTARSSVARPAPCEPVAPCPAPTRPSPDPASPPDPVAARSTGNVTARFAADAVVLGKRPYGEGQQPDGRCVEREPDELPEARVHRRCVMRRSRCNRQPPANAARPRHSEAPSSFELGADSRSMVTRTRATTLRSCDSRSPADRRCTWHSGSAIPRRCCPPAQRPRSDPLRH
ncbi:hypothetical protein BX257_6064 [Streptomyces sp. 3212.3]|nr:hypothetical protein BX257_6064 [Streptomyces sp. 3212.3]